MTNDAAGPDLGTCCICGHAAGVRTIIMLERRGPIAGRGWGCVQCGLPADGATAAVCDYCLDAYAAARHVSGFDGALPLKFACRGHPGTDGRIPITELSPEPFDHDMSKHPEATPRPSASSRPAATLPNPSRN